MTWSSTYADEINQHEISQIAEIRIHGSEGKITSALKIGSYSRSNNFHTSEICHSFRFEDSTTGFNDLSNDL